MVERTVQSMKGEKQISSDELFKGFNEEEYAKEAKTRWGNTSQFAESQKKWSCYSTNQKKEIKEEGRRIFKQMVGSDESKPDDMDVQEAVSEYFQYLTTNFYSCSLEFLMGLADGWVSDPRFTSVFENIREGGAAFAREAVYRYVEANA